MRKTFSIAALRNIHFSNCLNNLIRVDIFFYDIWEFLQNIRKPTNIGCHDLSRKDIFFFRITWVNGNCWKYFLAIFINGIAATDDLPCLALPSSCLILFLSHSFTFPFPAHFIINFIFQSSLLPSPRTFLSFFFPSPVLFIFKRSFIFQSSFLFVLFPPLPLLVIVLSISCPFLFLFCAFFHFQFPFIFQLAVFPSSLFCFLFCPIPFLKVFLSYSLPFIFHVLSSSFLPFYYLSRYLIFSFLFFVLIQGSFRHVLSSTSRAKAQKANPCSDLLSAWEQKCFSKIRFVYHHSHVFPFLLAEAVITLNVCWALAGLY